MKEWIDLTVLIDKSYLEYPGDIPFNITEEANYKNDGYNMLRISTNMHIGTHIDSRKHALDTEDSIEGIDYNKLIGKATVVKPRIIDGVIQSKDIISQYDSNDKIIIIQTNHSRYFNTEMYYDYPKFEKGIIQFLIQNKIEVIGMDMPSPKYINESFMQMHKDLLSNEILILENLTNLDKLNKHIEIIALPLKIKGLDGSLTRCIAKNRKDC